MTDIVTMGLVGSLLGHSYPEHLHVFTNAYVALRTSSVSAAVSIPSLDLDRSGRLSLMATSTIAKLAGYDWLFRVSSTCAILECSDTYRLLQSSASACR